MILTKKHFDNQTFPAEKVMKSLMVDLATQPPPIIANNLSVNPTTTQPHT